LASLVIRTSVHNRHILVKDVPIGCPWLPNLLHDVGMTNDWDRLARAIRERRRVLDLTQQQLADAARVTRTTVKNLEGARKPTSRLPSSMGALEQALGWAVGSGEAVLAGGEPTPAAPPQDTHQSLTGLPASVLDELGAGEVYATDIHDLSQTDGITIITVAVRRPGEPGEQISHEQRRRNFRAWSRVQRQLNGLPPLEWESGDPEEWKQHPEESQA
jgi:transcriptional regulator with XRE-family HTH domain